MFLKPGPCPQNLNQNITQGRRCAFQTPAVSSELEPKRHVGQCALAGMPQHGRDDEHIDGGNI